MYCVQRREEVHTGFWWGNLRERDHSEDPGVDGRIILRWIFRKFGLIWLDTDRLRALVNAVMKYWFS
jgi:hypothetical protein